MDKVKEIEDDIAELLANYDKESKGPNKLHVIGKGLSNYIKKVLDCAGRYNTQRMNKVESEYKTKAQEMETRIGLDKQELERLQDAVKSSKVKVNFPQTVARQH